MVAQREAAQAARDEEVRNMTDAERAAAFDAPQSGDGWTTTVSEYGEQISLTSKGEQFTGIFTGSHLVENFPDQNNPGMARDVLLWEFTSGVDENGFPNKYALWDSYNINKGMTPVPVGSEVRLTYMGKADIAGGKTVKEYRVEFKAPNA